MCIGFQILLDAPSTKRARIIPRYGALQYLSRTLKMFDKVAVMDCSPSFYRCLIVVEKSTGCFRPVTLSLLNYFFLFLTNLKMQVMVSVFSSIRKDRMMSINLKTSTSKSLFTGYLENFSGSLWGLVYQFKFLCIGLSTETSFDQDISSQYSLLCFCLSTAQVYTMVFTAIAG